MCRSTSLPDFAGLRVAVAGDLIADRYVYARPTRVSREAPVLVLRHERERVGCGGAANVARNVRALGARTHLIGVVGRDAEGRELLRQLSLEGIDTAGVEASDAWQTPTKTRILGAEAGRTPHQVVRIDREPEAPLGAAERGAAAARLQALLGKVDAVLVSDYGYGLVDVEVAHAARALQHAGARLVVDPRRVLDAFAGATAITPNLGELERLAGVELPEPSSLEAVAEAARRARERLAPEHLLVTLGNRGMALFSAGEPGGLRICASGSDEVVDVSGAGDTAAAAFTLALAAGLSGPAAMVVANAAAGVVVLETGTAVCTPAQLAAALLAAPSAEPSAQGREP
jgi:rfaE bifunctional protein kinase chain/domain